MADTKKKEEEKTKKKTKNINEFKKYWDDDQETRKIGTGRPVVRIFISREKPSTETIDAAQKIDEKNEKKANSGNTDNKTTTTTTTTTLTTTTTTKTN